MTVHPFTVWTEGGPREVRRENGCGREAAARGLLRLGRSGRCPPGPKKALPLGSSPKLRAFGEADADRALNIWGCMFALKSVGLVEKIRTLRQRLVLRQVHAPRHFAWILERERSRADRTGIGFSLITFRPRSEAKGRATLAQLVRILRQRLRCTDDLGWHAEDELGAALAHTDPDGAWTVVQDVCSQLPAGGEWPVCRVYYYPYQRDFEAPRGRTHEAHAPRLRIRVDDMEPLFIRALPAWKRGLDVLGALAGLVLLWPLMALIALGVKLTSPGPVFFRQLRAGLGGDPFLIHKFRTMFVDAEARQRELQHRNEVDGPAFKIRKDPRVTGLGRFLRATSLDELPQLWNVLRGQMSLVGPRPLPCQESAACQPWQRRRLHVTPGLTCIWQVRGRSTVSFPEWMRMDVKYVRRRWWLHDLELLLRTLPAVLLRKGAY